MIKMKLILNKKNDQTKKSEFINTHYLCKTLSSNWYNFIHLSGIRCKYGDYADPTDTHLLHRFLMSTPFLFV